MIYHHLNPAQREFIKAWLADNKKRPAFPAYNRASNAIAKIPVASKKPTPKSIKSVSPGFSAHEFVPKNGFDATRDLPAGWCAIDTHDSGSNHRVGNAGVCMLIDLWNCWSCKPDSHHPMEIGPDVNKHGVYKTRIYYELSANGITL